MVDQCTESGLVAVEFIPARGVSKERIATAARLLAINDSAAEKLTTGVSGIDADGKALRKGSCCDIRRYVESRGGRMPEAMKLMCALVRMYGGTPVVIAEGAEVLGVVHLCAAAPCGSPAEKTDG
jgi:K+-transporting ATPase ATPase B chain